MYSVASSVASILVDPEYYCMTNQMFNLKESQIQLFLAHCFTLSAFTTSKTNIHEGRCDGDNALDAVLQIIYPFLEELEVLVELENAVVCKRRILE